MAVHFNCGQAANQMLDLVPVILFIFVKFNLCSCFDCTGEFDQTFDLVDIP